MSTTRTSRPGLGTLVLIAGIAGLTAAAACVGVAALTGWTVDPAVVGGVAGGVGGGVVAGQLRRQQDGTGEGADEGDDGQA